MDHALGKLPSVGNAIGWLEAAHESHRCRRSRNICFAKFRLNSKRSKAHPTSLPCLRLFVEILPMTLGGPLVSPGFVSYNVAWPRLYCTARQQRGPGGPMRVLLAIVFSLIAITANAGSCQFIANRIYCDNGLSGQRLGSFTYWNDGFTSRHAGNYIYNSDGSSSQ